MAEIPSLPSLDRSIQKTDIPIKCGQLGYGKTSELGLLLRYMYYRSSESRSSTDPDLAIGQDYLDWAYYPSTDSFDFVVCDGVGQSYLGNIASEFLGLKLMDWLKNTGVSLVKTAKKNERTDGLGEILVKEILSWQQEANQRVNESHLPQSLPAMVQSALEGIRTNHGSESVFVCGHVGLEDGVPYLVLFWMGDVRFRLFSREGKEVSTGAEWKNSERWSTKYGLKGRSTPNCWVGSLHDNDICRVMVYSDGVSTIESIIHELSSAEMHYKTQQLLVSPSSDDISFIDILLSPFDSIMQKKFLHMPRKSALNNQLKLGCDLHQSECVLSWQKVNEAEQYIIFEETQETVWTEIFRSTDKLSFSTINRFSKTQIYKYKLKVIYSNTDEQEGPELSVELKGLNKSATSKVAQHGNDKSDTSLVRQQNWVSPELEKLKSVQSKQIELDKPELLDPTIDPSAKLVTLEWKGVEGAESYSIIVIIKGDMRREIIGENIIRTNFEWTPKGWHGEEYEIRVRAIKGAQAAESNSKIVQLKVLKPPLPVIEISKRSQIIVGDSFSLSCKPSNNGEVYSMNSKYQWQMSKSKKMEMPGGFPDNKPTLNQVINESGIYYYRVQVLQENTVSDWSELKEVEIAPRLEKPIINEPIYGSVVDVVFTLKCDEIVGGEEYKILFHYFGEKKPDYITYDKWGYSFTRSNGKCKFVLSDNKEGKFSFYIQVSDKYGNKVISDPVVVQISKNVIKQLPINPNNQSSNFTNSNTYAFSNKQQQEKLEKPQIILPKHGDTISNHNFTIMWSENRYVDYYIVWEKQKNRALLQTNGEWIRTVPPTKSNEVDILSASAGEHIYKVVAYRGKEEISSEELKINVDLIGSIYKKSLNKIDISIKENAYPNKHFYIEWNLPGRYEFKLFEADNEDFINAICIYSGGGESVRVPKKQSGKYFYMVKAMSVNSNDIEAVSDVVSVLVKPEKPIWYPVGYKKERTGIKVKFMWAIGGDVGSYSVKIQKRNSLHVIIDDSHAQIFNTVDHEYDLPEGIYEVNLIIYGRNKTVSNNSDVKIIKVTSDSAQEIGIK